LDILYLLQSLTKHFKQAVFILIGCDHADYGPIMFNICAFNLAAEFFNRLVWWQKTKTKQNKSYGQ